MGCEYYIFNYCFLRIFLLLFLHSISSNGTSIICRSESVEETSEVDVKVVIDETTISASKTFSYMVNPEVTDVKPNCGFRR